MNNTTVFHAESRSDPADAIAFYIILLWSVGLLVFTMTSGHPPRAQVQPQVQAQAHDWNLVGIYSLKRMQTLTKAEREALTAAGGGGAVFLYERVYPNGNVAWRYHVGDTTFYPKERNVRRRGLDLWGNSIEY